MYNYYEYKKNGFVVFIEENKPTTSSSTSFKFVIKGPFKGISYNEYQVRLIASYDPCSIEGEKSRIHIQDIRGNDYSTGLQGRGIGELLINLAVQIFRKNNYRPNTIVYGELDDSEDPKELNLSKKCSEGRIEFFKSFNFISNVNDLPHFECRLENVVITNKNKFIDGIIPRYIELDEFDVKSYSIKPNKPITLKE